MTDWKKLQAEIGDVVVDTMKGLVTGAQEDLASFGRDLAQNMISAVQQNRHDLVPVLVDQSQLLAEIHRVRLSKSAPAVLERALDIVFRVATAAVAHI